MACCCAGLGEGRCGQCVAMPLALLMQSVLVSMAQGVHQPHPYILIPSEVSCS